MSYGTLHRTSVRALLDDLGFDVTFRRVTEGAYDPATGTNAAGTTDDETVRVAFLEYSEREKADDTQIQRGDRKVIMAAVDASNVAVTKTPHTDDQFVGEGDTVSVVDAQQINVNGTLVGFICQVRS